MKARVDQETCIGCGLCVEIAPNVYRMEGDKAVVISEEISQSDLESAKNGAEQCPVNAITVS